MKKKIYEIRMVVFNGKPMLQTEVKGRIYRAEFNPFMKKEDQCNHFIDYIAENENKILMNDCDDFTDYIFRKMTGE